MSDHLKQEALLWAKVVGVIVAVVGVFYESGPVTGVLGIIVALYLVKHERRLMSHSEKIRELRRLP